MKLFVQMFHAIDSTTKTNSKIDAMVDYLQQAECEDAAWAVFFLCGYRLRQLVPNKLLSAWAIEIAQIPEWLFLESYSAVGDLAETLALLVPSGYHTLDFGLATFVQSRLLPLRTMSESQQRDSVIEIWREAPMDVRFVVMKLITGAFRVGVSKRMVTKAISLYCGVEPDLIAHRLMGQWEPSAEFFASLISREPGSALSSRPYPFCLATPVVEVLGEMEHANAEGKENEQCPMSSTLGNASDYVAEWKWDGIRGQIVRRQGEVYLWSRGEELMENRWPEIESSAMALPNGSVLDGEILAWHPSGCVMPFSQLQKRINRKSISKKLLHDVPVVFQAFDVLEIEGQDVRPLPWTHRRELLENMLNACCVDRIIPTTIFHRARWQELEEIRKGSREAGAEGLMIKRRDAPYGTGRTRGNWWKWKLQPYSIDAVLIYAQHGHGKRAGLFTDYTFAVWNNDQLVPFAKAYSGLDDREICEVDRFIRNHTREAFGPVRSVAPVLVMELAFEGLQKSNRHKCGIAVRFPRILRWRRDKRPEDANTLNDLMALIPANPID